MDEGRRSLVREADAADVDFWMKATLQERLRTVTELLAEMLATAGMH